MGGPNVITCMAITSFVFARRKVQGGNVVTLTSAWELALAWASHFKGLRQFFLCDGRAPDKKE